MNKSRLAGFMVNSIVLESSNIKSLLVKNLNVIDQQFHNLPEKILYVHY